MTHTIVGQVSDSGVLDVGCVFEGNAAFAVIATGAVTCAHVCWSAGSGCWAASSDHLGSGHPGAATNDETVL